MLVALGKVVGCALMLVTLTLFLAALSRNALIAILVAIGLWHVSNLAFDFAGLPELSYLEILRTMDKVLGGVVRPQDELSTLLWMGAFTAAFSFGALAFFITRDPPK